MKHPDEIRQKSFKSVLGGYKPAEVHAFLQEVSAQMEALVRQNEALQAELSDALSSMKMTAGTEEKIHTMLDEVQAATERLTSQADLNIAVKVRQSEQERQIILQNAKSEAEVVIHDAEKKADRILAEAENKVSRITDEISVLHASRQALISRITAILHSQIEFVESLKLEPQDSAPSYASSLNISRTREGIGVKELNDILQRLNEAGETE
jgi:cell division initiation protein